MTDEDLKKIGGIIQKEINVALEPIKKTLDEHTDKIDALTADIHSLQDSNKAIWEEISAGAQKTKQDIESIKTHIGFT